MKRILNFINGRYQEPRSGAYLSNRNPATGVVFSEFSDSDSDDVHLAVEAAEKAFRGWSKLSTVVRADYLRAIADAIEKRVDEFARAESEDQGKPVWLAREMDIPRAVSNFRFFANQILQQSEMATDGDGNVLNYTLRQPLGVVGLIGPWNLPLYLLTWKIAPALATGNTCVAKPSEWTPVTAALLCEVFREVGLPPGVCNIVHGKGSKVGEALTTHPLVKAISFTGGTKTGLGVAKGAAAALKKVSLELGGKNPCIIFSDANWDACLETTIRSSFLNQGEICLCGSRIYVEKSIYPKFVEDFVSRTQKLVVGNPQETTTRLGPLVSQEHQERVLAAIEFARQEGGQIETGGHAPKLSGPLSGGFFVEPTVITGLESDSRTAREEIFGPVVTVHPFQTEDEVTAMANDSKYGLAAILWTQDISRAHRIARNLEVGTVWINSWLLRDLRMPFGGVKSSGIGREGGMSSIEFFTERKTVCLKI